jgi:hypothetical protein
MGKQERFITIDCENLFMDTIENSKTLFGNGKSATIYHFSDVLHAVYSKKSPNTLKLSVKKDGSTKTYDIEADSNVASNFELNYSGIIIAYQLYIRNEIKIS